MQDRSTIVYEELNASRRSWLLVVEKKELLLLLLSVRISLLQSLITNQVKKESSLSKARKI